MERIKVGSVNINNFVLGAGRLGDIKYKKECFNILDRYLDLCYNTLDVARAYENGLCEEFLGEYLKNRKREDVILISKGGFPLSRMEMHKTRLSKEELQKDIDASLKAQVLNQIKVKFNEFKSEQVEKFIAGETIDSNVDTVIDKLLVEYIKKYISEEDLHNDTIISDNIKTVIEDILFGFIKTLIADEHAYDDFKTELADIEKESVITASLSSVG
jgi:hypothetical protein